MEIPATARVCKKCREVRNKFIMHALDSCPLCRAWDEVDRYRNLSIPNEFEKEVHDQDKRIAELEDQLAELQHSLGSM